MSVDYETRELTSRLHSYRGLIVVRRRLQELGGLVRLLSCVLVDAFRGATGFRPLAVFPLCTKTKVFSFGNLNIQYFQFYTVFVNRYIFLMCTFWYRIR